MENNFFSLLLLFPFLAPAATYAQKTPDPQIYKRDHTKLEQTITPDRPSPEPVYIDYQQFFNNVSGEFSIKRETVPKTAKELHDNAGRLIEDTPPVQPILISTGSQKVLSDEEIYAKRKNSVFILGKLFKKGDTPGDIRFDLTGTAFALTADGFCATNYHVLQNILRNNDPATDIDSVYFIITPDQKVYFIDEITAWSQNNDMAIFKVNTRGNQLTPIPFGNPACVGAAIYCISHPVGYFYYFSKGIVARNVIIPPQQAAAGYNPAGKPPVRMEITAEYGIGSSGGPILDKYGNLIGVVSSTMPIGTNLKGAEDSTTVYHQQMVIRDVIPVIVLKELLAVSTLRTPLGKFLFLI